MWWIIAIVFIIIIMVFLKFEHFKKNWYTAILIVILIIAYLSITAMLETGKMDFTSTGAAVNSFAVYFGWLGETTINLMGIGKDTIKTVGNVVRINNTAQT
jgi:multidrug transporter EmrE-like cation transporter